MNVSSSSAHSRTICPDDVGWTGGYVARGVELAKQMGFVEIYPISSGSDPRGCLVMQRVRNGS